MDLVRRVVDEVSVNDAKARDGVGLLLFAVRFATDQKTFDAIKRAVPDAQALLTQALATGGRTAEMLAVANPAAVKKNLANAGYTEAELNQLGQVVADGLVAALDETSSRVVRAAVEQVTAG